jgi:hypothetical protein
LVDCGCLVVTAQVRGTLGHRRFNGLDVGCRNIGHFVEPLRLDAATEPHNSAVQQHLLNRAFLRFAKTAVEVSRQRFVNEGAFGAIKLLCLLPLSLERPDAGSHRHRQPRRAFSANAAALWIARQVRLTQWNAFFLGVFEQKEQEHEVVGEDDYLSPFRFLN